MLSEMVTGLAALTLSSIAFFVWCWVDLLTIANRIRSTNQSCFQRRLPNHDPAHDAARE